MKIYPRVSTLWILPEVGVGDKLRRVVKLLGHILAECIARFVGYLSIYELDLTNCKYWWMAMEIETETTIEIHNTDWSLSRCMCT